MIPGYNIKAVRFYYIHPDWLIVLLLSEFLCHVLICIEEILQGSNNVAGIVQSEMK